jgi:hypothetical protein
MQADGQTDGRTDGRTDRQTDTTKLIAAFRNSRNAPKKYKILGRLIVTLSSTKRRNEISFLRKGNNA